MRRSHTLATVLAALAALVTALLTAPTASAAVPSAIRGGDVLYGSGGDTCTVGFNARSDSTYYAIVSSSCTPNLFGGTWYADPDRTVRVGMTAGYGLIRYINIALSYPGEVSLGGGTTQDITGSAAPHVGQSVCHVGRSSGTRCGTVRQLNVTVQYPEGPVHGLFTSSACAQHGDNGGPAFSGTTALGLVVGGSGSCATGGTTYYQPITKVLADHGLRLY
ncbi:MAG TPA: S1 family peptidase [Streptomyces sp.]|nr:S1 family peptidase [Streptomyces sp.]